METSAQALCSFFADNFLNFLRGMETRRAEGPSARAAGFLNFLRGMETCIPYTDSLKWNTLPKLP